MPTANARRSEHRTLVPDAGDTDASDRLPQQPGPFATSHPFETLRMFDIPVARASTAEVVRLIVTWSASGPARSVVTANLDHVMKLRTDPAFREAYARAALITADGMPFVLLSRLEGQRLPERVTGSGLIAPVCVEAARQGRSVFLLGSTPARLRVAEDCLRTHAPDLRVAGRLSPPFGFDRDPDEIGRIADSLRRARPDIVLVALGAPKQELLSDLMVRTLDHGVFLNIGGGLDFLSGDVARAPALVQRLGLEWFWRAASEPRRLGPRYVRIIAALPSLYRIHRQGRRTEAPLLPSPRKAL